MPKFDGSKLRSVALACMFAGVAGAVALPQAAWAQPAAVVRGLPDFTDLVDQVGPSVVNIRTVEKASSRAGASGMDEEMLEFFRRFGVPIPNQPRQQRPQRPQQEEEQQPRGVGSGFILTADGFVMTNAHVVDGADEVIVTLPDKREFKAKIVGADKRTDVAVVKIEATGLPAVKVGDVSRLRVGEWVMAIGSPFGLENTVTAGIVSAKQRDTGDYLPFIQTDVAINPGNSGGPLFNTRGEVVGINSQIYSQTGGFQGLSFAIPIDLAGRIKDQIVATGKASHAKLGVTVQEVNQGFADSFKLATPEGALVANVERGSPADKAGLKSGDVVRKVNGQRIIGSADLPALVGTSLPGDKISMDVWRDGKIVSLTATLGNAADKVAEVAKSDSAAGKVKLGLALRPLQSDEKREAGISAGLLVEDAGGAAANAGVQPGDVLLSVNGRPVNTVEQVRDVVEKSAKSVALLIQRGPDKIFIPVRLG